MTRSAEIRRRSGFTLIEMMVAVLIGAIAVVAAAKVAEIVLRQSAEGRQRTDFSSRAQLLGRQMRSDLRVAGVGATGAVAVDDTVIPFNTLATPSAGNYPAIPVIGGANNINGAAIGGVTLLPGSDAIQVLVPNPTTVQRTSDYSRRPGNQVMVPNPAVYAPANCPMLYISDHSGPTGGRSHLARINNIGAGAVVIEGTLQFTVAPDSDVMCARLSTYWIDDQAWLHRSDFTGAGGLVQLSSSVWVDSSNVGADRVVPGVLDLQIAYRVSAEAYRLAQQAPPGPANIAAHWAFAGGGSPLDGLMNTPSSWFEVRQVRFNMLGRTLRKIQEQAGSRAYARLEDGASFNPGTIDVPWHHPAEWTTSSENVTNLRYFDLRTPSGMAAEPF